jgi:hypothetical protein
MITYRIGIVCFALQVAALGLGGVAFAQTPPPQPVIYPANGQSAEQQAVDRDECYAWASRQTGYDPVQALQQQQALLALQARQAASAAPPPSGQVVGGAAGGAAGGALIGAVAGNAGRGAAIGASVGAITSIIRGRSGCQARSLTNRMVECHRAGFQVS